jgi:hypothetical protein
VERSDTRGYRLTKIRTSAGVLEFLAPLPAPAGALHNEWGNGTQKHITGHKKHTKRISLVLFESFLCFLWSVPAFVAQSPLPGPCRGADLSGAQFTRGGSPLRSLTAGLPSLHASGVRARS